MRLSFVDGKGADRALIEKCIFTGSVQQYAHNACEISANALQGSISYCISVIHQHLWQTNNKVYVTERNCINVR